MNRKMSESYHEAKSYLLGELDKELHIADQTPSAFMCDGTSKVYASITGGEIVDPNKDAIYVLLAYKKHVKELVENAFEEISYQWDLFPEV